MNRISFLSPHLLVYQLRKAYQCDWLYASGIYDKASFDAIGL